MKFIPFDCTKPDGELIRRWIVPEHISVVCFDQPLPEQPGKFIARVRTSDGGEAMRQHEDAWRYLDGFLKECGFEGRE